MLFYFACEAAGASAPGIPHALLEWKAERFIHTSGAFAPRERGCVCCRGEMEARCISSRFTREQPFSAEARGVADPRRELSRTKNLLEPRFCRASESAFAGLEIQTKMPMYSISYGRRLCARRTTPFMAEMAYQRLVLASLIRDILKGLT